jgi:hypothetical protein
MALELPQSTWGGYLSVSIGLMMLAVAELVEQG